MLIKKYTPPTYNNTFSDYRAACQYNSGVTVQKSNVSAVNECYMQISPSGPFVKGSGNANRNVNGAVNFACQLLPSSYCSQLGISPCPH